MIKSLATINANEHIFETSIPLKVFIDKILDKVVVSEGKDSISIFLKVPAPKETTELHFYEKITLELPRYPL